MSTLRTQKVTPLDGETNLILGDSGDTVTIPAGVTLAGNIPAANLTGTLPAISGANLTNLPVPSPHTGNVTFPASQVASSDANTLDDYEEGTFTPVLQGGSTAGVTANGTGYYTKIGRLVSCDIRLNNVAISGGSGDAKISGFPFTMSNGGVSGAYGVALPLTYKVTHGGVRNGFYTGGGGTAIYGLESHSATGWAPWHIGDFFGTGNIYINLSIVYISS